MQRDKLLKQQAILKINGVDPIIIGTIIDVTDDGVWLILSHDFVNKLAPSGSGPLSSPRSNLFVPFSSITWMLL